jgi:hypothetical protein
MFDDMTGDDRVKSAQLVMQKRFERLPLPDRSTSSMLERSTSDSERYLAESGGIGVINDRRQPSVSLRGNRTIAGTELKDFRRSAFEPIYQSFVSIHWFDSCRKARSV